MKHNQVNTLVGNFMEKFFNTNQWNKIRYTAMLPVYSSIIGLMSSARSKSIKELKLKGNERILIVGVGPGLDLKFLPKAAHIQAIDITPAMVKATQKQAEKLGMKHAVAKVMDGMEMQLNDESFDVVILHLILAVIPDPERCMKEVARVLKPHGKVAIFDKFLPDDSRSTPLWREAFDLLATVVATHVNRKLGPMIDPKTFEILKREDSLGGGFFQLAQLQKRGK